MAAGETIVRVLASISALYMCLCPAPTMYRIHERKAVDCMPLLPLASQWSYNHTWYETQLCIVELSRTHPCRSCLLTTRMLYGYIVREYFPLLVTYAIGSGLSVLFLAIYYSNSGDQRRTVLKLIAYTLMFNTVTTAYTIVGSSIQSKNHVKQTIGACSILCGLLLYASPFATILDVVRTKSAASMPIAMICVGALSNAIWIVYGFLQHDLVVAIPTIVNLVFCLMQLVLYAVYHPNRRSLKATVLGSHCHLAAEVRQTDSPQMASEHEVSFVRLETPKYEEILGQIAVET